MKHIAVKRLFPLASILLLFPIAAEDAAKDKTPSAQSAFAFPDRPDYVTLKPAAFDKLRRSNTNAVVLDVRTPEEYAAGHLHGAVLLNFRSPDFTNQLARLDKTKTYLVHCAAGGRSAKACEKMHTLGFSRIVNLEGGLTAWQEAGKPVEK